MPFRMTGRGRKNPRGIVDRSLSQRYTTRTFTSIDIDPARNDGTTEPGIGRPGLTSSGVQFYSMDFALENEPGGIVGARVERIANTVQNGYTYLTYRVTLTVDRNSTQRSITIGSPTPSDPNTLADFYFSSLSIGRGAAIAGSGRITGTPFRDALIGSAGNDTIDGGGGADYMRGGLGNDTYIVRDVNTQIDETPRTGIETVISYVNWSLKRQVTTTQNDSTSIDFNETDNVETGLDHLTLAGNAAINGIGNNLPNIIKGNSANNVLSGEGGNDTLIGGGGNDSLSGGDGNDELNGFGTVASTASQFDTLNGGAGNDVFVLGGTWGVSYIEPGDGYAVITDWTATQDRIKVKNVPGGTYSLEFKSLSGIGSALFDTEIYFTDSRGFKDRIGIVQDSVNVNIARDFVFV